MKTNEILLALSALLLLGMSPASSDAATLRLQFWYRHENSISNTTGLLLAVVDQHLPATMQPLMPEDAE